jgi:glucokinase
MTNKAVFGIDIGGTSVKCGLFSDKGELLDKTEIPTRKEDNGSHILDDITAHIKEVLERFGLSDSGVAGIGMGVPGSVKNESVVNKCINLGWGVVDVAEEMRKRISIPVKAGNDANLAALGEYWQGDAKGCSSMIMVTIGTGVGGGYILDGRPVEGFNGAAAEIGHFPIVAEETEYCNCGKKGCLEQVASATGIVRTAKRYLKEEQTTSILRQKEDFSAKDVFDAAKLGDKLAVRVTEYTAEYLAKGLACAAAVADPECFVIGGGVSAAGDYLIDLLVKYYKIHVFHPSRETKILKASLGNDAGMYGAARLMI